MPFSGGFGNGFSRGFAIAAPVGIALYAPQYDARRLPMDPARIIKGVED